MIDPIQSLAFSMHSNPGVYALLLGSGLSTSAGIKTGWGIVVDLLGQLAAAADVEPDVDLESWYRDKYEEEPDYSKLLSALAKTPTERQQLLRQYFEPTDQEREDGLKQPTEAHKAIAKLVSKGFIRLIITTNFDQLMEKALEDEGVVAQVLSSLDQVRGAYPLSHNQPCVFKVHGDYRDSRIRNSPAELISYPQEVNEILDRVFDEFGLIVCGWSGEWDSALRDAIYRASSRRFTTYWALYEDPGDEARRLIDHRRAETVDISNADVLFQTLEQAIESIEEFSRPHPLSAEVAVASLKRYMSGPEHRIRLFDLIDASIHQAVTTTSGARFRLHGDAEPNRELITERIRAYESTYAILLSMSAVGGYWAEDEHFQAWAHALQRLVKLPLVGGYEVWLALRAYPAVLLLYSLGIGAVERENYELLSRIFRMKVADRSVRGETVSFLYGLFFQSQLLTVVDWQAALEGMERRYFPMNDWMHDALRDSFSKLIPDDERYTLVFDMFEIIVSAAFGRFESRSSYGYLPGSFIYRSPNRHRVVTEVRDSIDELEAESPFVTCGIFGDNPTECRSRLQELSNYVSSIRQSRGIFD